MVLDIQCRWQIFSAERIKSEKRITLRCEMNYPAQKERLNCKIPEYQELDLLRGNASYQK